MATLTRRSKVLLLVLLAVTLQVILFVKITISALAGEGKVDTVTINVVINDGSSSNNNKNEARQRSRTSTFSDGVNNNNNNNNSNNNNLNVSQNGGNTKMQTEVWIASGATWRYRDDGVVLHKGETSYEPGMFGVGWMSPWYKAKLFAAESDDDDNDNGSDGGGGGGGGGGAGGGERSSKWKLSKTPMVLSLDKLQNNNNNKSNNNNNDDNNNNNNNNSNNSVFYFHHLFFCVDVVAENRVRAARVVLSLSPNCGASVYLNGVKVLSEHMIMTMAKDEPYYAPRSAAANVDPALFVEGENLLAVEIHCASVNVDSSASVARERIEFDLQMLCLVEQSFGDEGNVYARLVKSADSFPFRFGSVWEFNDSGLSLSDLDPNWNTLAGVMNRSTTRDHHAHAIGWKTGVTKMGYGW